MQTSAHLNKSLFNDLRFRIKMIFTKSISGVVLKLVKMKNRPKSLSITSIQIYAVQTSLTQIPSF